MRLDLIDRFFQFRVLFKLDVILRIAGLPGSTADRRKCTDRHKGAHLVLFYQERTLLSSVCVHIPPVPADPKAGYAEVKTAGRRIQCHGVPHFYTQKRLGILCEDHISFTGHMGTL